MSALALSASPVSLKADLVYHLPFDDGAGATLANGGTAGGTATGVGSSYGITGAPTASSSPVKLGSHSEFYTTNPSNTVYGGATLLPNSTTNFRLDNASSQMTISTWVYWNGVAGTNNRYGIANLFPSNNAAGWSLAIDNNGKLVYAFQTDTNLSRSRTTTDAVVTASSWINVALTVDTSIASNSAITIYVNGVQQALTGSALSSAVTLTNPGDIALGVYNHTSGAGGAFALNGHLDDYAMWDTALSAAKIKALNTSTALLSDYDAGVMNSLFTAYDEQSASVAGTTTWSYATAFDVSGKALGDTWLGGDGRYYIWLDGTSGGALGLVGVNSIPEPATTAILAGLAVLLVPLTRRSRQGRR
ncbi:MAG: LamG domain-containing protein [Verrucomicrobiota bacterium]